jgi:hypothetical protein
MAAKKQHTLGTGLDIGTMNIVSARREGEDTTTNRVRDAFLDLGEEAKRMLKLSGVNFIDRGEDGIIVVGDAAMEMANVFGREARRPLSQGLIAAGEMEALDVLGVMIKSVLGDPKVKGEACYFSVPASPVDADRDVVYHRGVFERIVTECGYTAYPSNEAMAIIYAETAKEGFSGLGISFGSGMCNLALAVVGVEGLSFSLARCLAADFPVVTPLGMTPIKDIEKGSLVLDALGNFVEVLEVFNNGPREVLTQITLKHLSGFPMRMTPDHKVFVKRRFGWEWEEASAIKEGDILGIPVIAQSSNKYRSYYFGRSEGKDLTVAGSRNLGRFLGFFLGDGSCGGPHKDGPRYVQLAINREHQHLVEKYTEVCRTLFHREVQISNGTDENLTRMKLHVSLVARHMKKKFYSSTGDKVCPLDLSAMSDQMALGIIEGLFDSDGHTEPKRRTFTNTSQSLVVLMHHLLNRFGIRHSIQNRGTRLGGTNAKGVQFQGRKDAYEVRVDGHVANNLLNTLLSVEGHCVFDQHPDFMLYEVSSVEEAAYTGDVYDLRVDSPHSSFSSYGAVVHNCGDWIDAGAAKATGSTKSRICALKEKGVDLMAPEGREQEALALYYKALIEYCIDQTAKEFDKIKDRFALPKPIPIVISGGTSLAGNFVPFFEQVFAKKRKRFPIEVSEIRHASDPLNAVARGLLIQAMQEEE